MRILQTSILFAFVPTIGTFGPFAALSEQLSNRFRKRPLSSLNHPGVRRSPLILDFTAEARPTGTPILNRSFRHRERRFACPPQPNPLQPGPDRFLAS